MAVARSKKFPLQTILCKDESLHEQRKLFFIIEDKLPRNEIQSQLVRPKTHAKWFLKSNIDISKEPPWRAFLVVSTFFFSLRLVEKWREGRRGGRAGVEKKWKKEEKAFNLFTVTVLRWFQQNAEYFSVSQGPDFVHRAARATGSQQTLIAPKPKAAPFKQGHSSSHRKGNGLWPWSLIAHLHPQHAAVYKVIRETLW